MIVFALGLSAQGFATERSLAPVGELTVNQVHLRTGVRPLLTWKIEYPTIVEDLVEIHPTGEVRTREKVTVSVRAIGSGWKTAKSNNGHGNNIDGVDISNPGRGRGGPNGEVDTSAPIDDEKKVNGNKKVSERYIETALWVRNGEGSSWERIYHGSAADLQPDHSYYDARIGANQSFDLAARGRHPDQDWGTEVTTAAPSSQLIVLKDGDPLPEKVGSYNTGEIASYLTGHVDENNRVFLGPNELIYLFDLDSAPGSINYDLQDLGVHVLFQPTD
ncbi:MAG: hypothetical protein HKO57_09375 [Akkermansiaceae bacterium]|nr:hypothetical protein [Akkermansiaceae bacterium]